MSVSVVLVPIALGPNLVMGLIASVVASTALTVKQTRDFHREINEMNVAAEDILAASSMQKDFNSQKYQAICSQYKTMFTDENLLIKTISEHGLQNISSVDGKITGTLEGLSFEFEKGKDGIYEMHITHKQSDDLSIINELKDEYEMNVQEQSYMNIKKNLEKQNLTIESEEVLEDNSIMITVNW